MNSNLNFEMCDFSKKILTLYKFHILVKASIINNSLKHNFKNCYLFTLNEIYIIDYVDYQLSTKDMIYFKDNKNNLYQLYYCSEKNSYIVKPYKEITEKTFLLKYFGLDENATIEMLKKEYKKLANKFHPDKITGDSSIFVSMKTKYEILLHRYFNTNKNN